MKWTEALISDIRIQLQEAGHGKKRELADRIAEELGVSTATLYRRINVTDGKKRCEREPEVDSAYIDLIAKIKSEPFLYGVKGRMISTEDAIDIAEQSGELPEGILTTATADRRLRERGFNQQRAYTRHEDDYVNHVHQLDFSRSEYFEVVERDGEMMVRVDGRRGVWEYKNKPKAQRLRLWLAGYLDTYSRAYIVRYFAATGENMMMSAQFLQFAWNRNDDMHPLVHLPDILKLDQGALGKTAAFRDSLQKRLGIRVELAAPKNDRLADNQSMGKVERRFRTLWQRFELKLAYMLKKKDVQEITLADLNVLVHDYCCGLLKKRHPVRNQTIGEVYRAGLRMQEQRKAEADIFSLLFHEDTRVVNAYGEISIDNQLYRVPAKYIKQKIKFYINPEGALVGSSQDGKDSFNLIPIDDVADSTGTKRHTPTYKEEQAAKPAELDGSKLRILHLHDEKEEQSPTLPHEEKEITPATPFHKVATKNAYSDWDQAKMDICEVFNRNWGEISPKTQQLFKRLFDAEELDKVAIEDLFQEVS